MCSCCRRCRKLVDRDRHTTPALARGGDLEALARYVRGVMGTGCRVTFEFLDAIAPAASGKYRTTVSLVAR